MNLETTLQPRLWEVIRASIESRNFSAAVLDAIHLLSDVIRERSGLEGDGVQLIGAAFGGNAPKLKVNRLQTESEQNVQRGIESLLRGTFQAIRNPRSHGTHNDDEKDAIAILLFLDYLLRIVDQSRSPFSLASFVGRVLDADFVPTERYAALLVKEVPQNKRLLVCREIFSRRAEVNVKKIRAFLDELINKMSVDETNEICELISDELKCTDDEDTIRFVVGGFPDDVWSRLDEIARIRIEHKLINSVRQGKWAANRCASGSLGSWINQIIYHLTLNDEFWSAVFVKLRSSDRSEQDYAFHYFTHYIDRCHPEPPRGALIAVRIGLRAGDSRFKSLVSSWKWDNDYKERTDDDPWRKPFAELLAQFKPADELTDDDVPF